MKLLKINFIHNIDSLEGLKKLSSKSVDLAFTDPPYNLRTDFGNYKDNLPREKYFKMIRSVLEELKRVTKKGFGIYVYKGLFQRYKDMLPEAEPIMIGPSEGFWHYSILTTAKPLKSYYKKLWKINLVNEEFMLRKKFNHPAQTSLNATKRFLEYFSKEGDLILDCFAGCGTTAAACKELKRNFLGFEVNPDYCTIANERL